MTHALTRTSPFGDRFVGRCDKCGQEGFGMGGALEPCPMDHLVSDEQALLDCLSRDDDPARADLPPTLSAAMELPEVKALVEATSALIGVLEIASVLSTATQRIYIPRMDAPELVQARATIAKIKGADHE